MLIDSSAIFVLFRIINFLIFIGICCYSYWIYFLPVIDAEIIAQENHTQQLKKNRAEKRLMLRDTQDFEKQQIALCEELSQKVARWEQAYERIQAEHYLYRETLKEQLVHKVALQNKNIRQERIAQTVFPQAITQLRYTLKNEMVDDKYGKDYIAALIRSIKK